MGPRIIAGDAKIAVKQQFKISTRLFARMKGTILILAMLWAFLPACTSAPKKSEILPTATQSADRLAEPALPANPTQYDEGRHLYWLNCMPCHGDRGQGLTDEFRSLWEEDHQNCWARGCHAGRIEDEGFPLPHAVPAIISSSEGLLARPSAEDLFAYLHNRHPPQNPGSLADDEYWALTAYILTENNSLPPGQEVGPQEGLGVSQTWWFVAGALALLVIGALLVFSCGRQKFSTTIEE